MARRPSIAIVGCGRAGGSIGVALHRAGWPVAAVWSRSAPRRRRAAELLNAPVARTVADAASAADVVIVAVPDDAIEDVARDIAGSLHPGTLVAHTSGATSVEALAVVRAAGARPASMHPLQTLTDPRADAEALCDAPVAITCEPNDRPLLRRMVRAWGGRPFDLADKDKPAYHAAAVFASNYLVASVWAATELLAQAGLPNGHRLLEPLVLTTARNVTRDGARRSITGPAARGDVGTLRRHMAASDDDRIRDAYRSMARLAAAAAGREVAL